MANDNALWQSGFGKPVASTYRSNTISPTDADQMTCTKQSSLNPPQKRTTPPSHTARKPSKKVKRVGPRTDGRSDAAANGVDNGEGSASRPKRVRTGCLTCRQRHLKCDEAMPMCNNCLKSSRECERGVRLNFIDIWAEAPPTSVSLYGTADWKVEFLDESREIASEYVGGAQKYRPLRAIAGPTAPKPEVAPMYDYASSVPAAPIMTYQPFPPVQSSAPTQFLDSATSISMTAYSLPPKLEAPAYPMGPPTTASSHSSGSSNQSNPVQFNINGTVNVAANQSSVSSSARDTDRKECIDNGEETLLMQVFIEEVGLWMDSMDPLKHFSRLLPFHALSEPMLLNAFLACGARHLRLVNPSHTEEKALHYYDTATSHLLRNLQNPNRDTVICATTAVILNVYEIMSERALQRMNHIAGARALIKECGWNAKAQGIGAACFWLNVGLEVLSCLHFNWQVAWNPDDWELDLDLSREAYSGNEEAWTHKMLYILAKVCNFRATIPRAPEQDPRDQQTLTQQRFEEWSTLKRMVEAWDEGIPRTMKPMAYLHPGLTKSSASAFPEVWLVKRTSIVARLFFHTAQLLLSQMHPYYGVENAEIMRATRRHSNMICGIVAHVKDRGVASVAIRSLHHAAEVLTDRREQEEVLEIFDKIHKDTGWRVGFVYKELKERWGWIDGPTVQQAAQTHTGAKEVLEAQHQQHQQHQQQAMQNQQKQRQQHQAQAQHSLQQQLPTTQNSDINFTPRDQNMQRPSITNLPPPQSIQPTPQPSQQPTPIGTKKMPTGIPNPLYAKADFSLQQHPYMEHYVPPKLYAGGSGQQQMYYSF